MWVRVPVPVLVVSAERSTVHPNKHEKVNEDEAWAAVAWVVEVPLWKS